MEDPSSGLGDRCRYPAWSELSLRISMKMMLVLIALIAVLLVPVAWLVNHSSTWGPAEHTADVLHRLAGEIIENDLTDSEIIELLKSSENQHHGIHKFHVELEKRPDELIWFAPNNKYTVGLSTNGSVIWMTNGKRHDE